MRQKESLDHNCFTLLIFKKEFCENVKVEKSTGDIIPVKRLTVWIYTHSLHCYSLRWQLLQWQFRLQFRLHAHGHESMMLIAQIEYKSL